MKDEIKIEEVEAGPTAREEGRRREAVWRRNVVLWVLLAVLAGVVGYRVVQDRLDLRRPMEFTGGGEVFGEKINPNTASWASLARLPGVGEKTAKAIVAYRESFVAGHPGETRAFTGAGDLMKIKGLGAATVKQMEPYLEF